MSIKKYKANSEIAINVVLDSGSSVHVAFQPVTGKGSTFTTSNEVLQKAMEKHHMFGKLFRLEETKPQKVKEEESGEADNEEKKVTVACLSDAKEYLAERFGVSRTSLRSREKVMKVAAEKGIVFEGLE